MAEQETPPRHAVEVGAALTSLMQVQAFVAGRLYSELAAAGLMTDGEAADRLERLATDIAEIDGFAWAILEGVAMPMRGHAGTIRGGDRPRLHLADKGEGGA